MHPRPFAYQRAYSVQEALELLAADAEAKVLAGGQSLVPMMSLGLVAPSQLVDIGRLECDGIERHNGSVIVGALTRHRELERSKHGRELLPLAAEAAAHIGNPHVRNRGTFGGSLAHADPAAELPAVVLAYGGNAIVAGTQGERRIELEHFFQDVFTTALQPGELLLGVELVVPSRSTATAFVEYAERADDFALAAAAALLEPNGDGTAIKSLRLAMTGVGNGPVRLRDVEQICAGERVRESLLQHVRDTVIAGLHPEHDAYVSSRHRRRVAAACAGRAIGTAWNRALERM